MKDSITIKYFFSNDIAPLIPDLARLRITVFRDFPYLYEGSYDYEKEYLKVYTNSSASVLVAAFDGDKVIGAATALPLKDEAQYVIEPFQKAQMNIEDIYYFGESVLLKEYRGLGLGHAFFDGRELAAKKFQYKIATFCAVNRPINHQRRPENYQPLDEFWKKKGFTKNENLIAQFSWQDIDELKESAKSMTYWMKHL